MQSHRLATQRRCVFEFTQACTRTYTCKYRREWEFYEIRTLHVDSAPFIYTCIDSYYCMFASMRIYATSAHDEQMRTCVNVEDGLHLRTIRVQCTDAILMLTTSGTLVQFDHTCSYVISHMPKRVSCFRGVNNNFKKLTLFSTTI